MVVCEFLHNPLYFNHLGLVMIEGPAGVIYFFDLKESHILQNCFFNKAGGAELPPLAHLSFSFLFLLRY